MSRASSSEDSASGSCSMAGLRIDSIVLTPRHTHLVLRPLDPLVPVSARRLRGVGMGLGRLDRRLETRRLQRLEHQGLQGLLQTTSRAAPMRGATVSRHVV
jgi:hypothetical protein